MSSSSSSVVWSRRIAVIFGLVSLAALALAGAVYFEFVELDAFDRPTTLAVAIIGAITLVGSITTYTLAPSMSGDPRRPREKTASQKLANELNEVATKSEVVINAIGDGVIALDGRGIIELINPAAQEILGWGKQDALMLNYKSVFQLKNDANQEVDPSQNPIDQVLNTNQLARSNKLSVVTKSGKKLNLSIVVSPIGDPGAGVIIVFHDVTKERAEEREQAEFISTASHEMRTPVASIEGYLGLALNPNTSQIDEKARGFIMKAHESAQHLGRLFQDLLDVSRTDDGRLSNTPHVVNIIELAQSTVESLGPKAKEKGLQLIFKPTQTAGQKKIMPVFYVNQDNDHIREILDNLIENAIKYTPEGSVIVDVTGTDNKAVVSVKDSGLGIPAEDLPHLFQKFYRIDNADRQAIGGTGLGLYLSRRLAEVMQGRLWVESVYQQGSTFFLELPRIDSAEAQTLKQQQDAEAAQKAAQQPAPAPALAAQPAAAPVAAANPAAPAPQPTQAATPPAAGQGVKPATTVPRGESLSRDQINARVKQLEEMAKQQREVAPERPQA